jgi:replicative DNA helicase
MTDQPQTRAYSSAPNPQPGPRPITSLVPPYSEEAEEAVLGSVLVNPEAFLTVASFLKSEDFYLIRHAYIWGALERLSSRNEPIDYLTLVQELKDMGWLNDIGGPGYITRLVNNTPTSMHAEFYGRIVERTALRRRLMATADEIKALALDETMDIDSVVNTAETRLFSVTDRQLKREFVPMHDAVSEYFDRIEHLMQHQTVSLGVPSGFKKLDELLGGFQRSDLLIFAGRPGMGKCVAAGTLIHTARGLMPIESLRPADAPGQPDDESGTYYPLEIGVQTPDGLRPTSHFYDSGPRPTLRITTRAGYALAGTLAHPVLVRGDGGKPLWLPLAALCPGDAVAVELPALACASARTTRAHRHALPDTYGWDEIVAVEDAGVQPCYDVVVPDGHAFVANGIVNHNTSFLLSAATNAARLGGRIAIFTMEMGADQIVQRIVAMETGINTQKLRLGQLNQQEYARFVEAAGRIARFPIFIDDTPALTPIQMRTKCRRLQHEYGIDMVIVDYMQLMNAGGTYQNNRVQEISYISRALKELARELNVPIFSAAQLSRAVEQRQDKRPVLSDLRESGCLAGESRVWVHDEGRYVPIRDLAGRSGFRVLSVNPTTYKLEVSEVSNAFSTGMKPVYRLTTQLGRSIRATGNHQFLTIHGWKRLDELTGDDRIALPRELPALQNQTVSEHALALLGHLIGDGCTIPTHAIQYTTREIDLAETVANLATSVFGDAVKPRIHKEKNQNWYQVFIPPSYQLTHGVYSPVRQWLEQFGIWGLRSYEKFVPEQVFAQPRESIATFLRHLWSTDGCIAMKKVAQGYYPHIYYASSSLQLASGVQTLLLRFGINARLKTVPQIDKGRDQYHVILGGGPDLALFVKHIGAVSELKKAKLDEVGHYLATHEANTNRDVIPSDVWRKHVVPAMQKNGITSRKLHERLEMSYAGTTLYKQNIGRERAARVAAIVGSQEIEYLAESDLYWDSIAAIVPDGEAEVFDLTVPGNSNFLAEDIVVHNSIEQDSDIVIFLYRDVVYNEATEFPNQADLIVAKHRNGPTGTVSLYFDNALTKFMDGAVRRVDLGEY